MGKFDAEADAQQQLEEARILWLNRLRNRDLDRLERARRAVPAGDNTEKIEEGLEFPGRHPENDLGAMPACRLAWKHI